MNDIGLRDQVSIISPYNGNGILFHLISKMIFLVSQINQELSIFITRKYFHFLIKQQICNNSKILPNITKIVYAQDPLSAKAGLELRKKHIVDNVVLVVHFNVSEASEILAKGLSKPNGLLVRNLNNLEKETIPFVNRIVFVSQYMENKVLERMPEISNVSRKVIPNFISCLETDETIDIFGDLITIGTIEPRKNQEYSIRIMDEISKRGYLYNLTIVGDGSDRKKIENLVDNFGLKNYVKLVGSKPEAGKQIKHFKVYIHTAKMENLPIVIIEALSAGKPVFVFPVGGIPEQFMDGLEGFYLTGEVKTDADKLIKILSNSDLYKSASARAKETSKKFSSDFVGPIWIKFVLGRS